MLPMIAGMMGSNSPVVGFVFHMIISLMFGVIFTIFANMVRWNTKASRVLYGDGSLEMTFHLNSGSMTSMLVASSTD
jgi:uncharacterized membrane protein YagU involved in acid resistance